MRAVLHIGGGKCGSSALQRALTDHPLLDPARPGDPGLEYLMIRNDGVVRRGAALRRQAVLSPSRYAVSAPIPTMAAFDQPTINRIRDQLRAVTAEARVPVLSHEAWYARPHDTRRADLLRRLRLEAELVCFVRPQVAWTNSAWWQWGAWTGATLDEWLGSDMAFSCHWERHLEGWDQVPGVAALRVVPLGDDVVEQFAAMVGAAPPPTTVSNRSLPGELLRFLQLHPGLRRDLHDSGIDFVLERRVRVPDASPTPWVLRPDHVATIVERSRRDNEALLRRMAPAHAEAVRADPRWWDPEAWADRVAEPERVEGLDAERLDALALALVEALSAADAEHREAETARHDLRVRLDQIRRGVG